MGLRRGRVTAALGITQAGRPCCNQGDGCQTNGGFTQGPPSLPPLSFSSEVRGGAGGSTGGGGGALWKARFKTQDAKQEMTPTDESAAKWSALQRDRKSVV